MQSTASSPDQYVASMAPDIQSVFTGLRQTIQLHLPPGFKETMSYGMIGYVVPHNRYPAGYHCDPKLPLPFMSIAAQKNFIAIYHMGIYAMPELMDWFTKAHAKISPKKLDMGKSCIRYKKPTDIPLALIGELATKITVDEWIGVYENTFKRKS